MTLPPVITLDPLEQPVTACVPVPGSKSITNRALILAALGHGQTTLQGALWSEDTQVMVDCLQQLGCQIDVSSDPAEPANRTLRVQGWQGTVPPGGTSNAPLELFVGNAGTAARFLAALVAIGRGSYRLHGVPRMHDRPQQALFTALGELGYRVHAPAGRLPAVIEGAGPRPGASCRVNIDQSSQFASALLLGAAAGGWQVTLQGQNDEEQPYVTMTRRLIEVFPRHGGEFFIEPDASSGSYFWAINALNLPATAPSSSTSDRPMPTPVTVARWPSSGWQVDEAFPRFLPLPAELSRRRHLGDSIMTAIVLAPLSEHSVRFTDLGRLRLQECERVQALRTGLTRCGARVTERGDTLEVEPSPLHGADIDTCNDHRLAMCFSILGLKIPGLRIHHPACVRKTFPNFFARLAARDGLGVTVRDARDGRKLTPEELTAG